MRPVVAVPPPTLRYLVHGSTNTQAFLRVGRQCSRDLQTALRRIGRPLDSHRRALDFGCGCGRVLRWLTVASPGTAFSGTDLEAPAIAWSREHMPGVQVRRCRPDPPLPYAAATFDLVLAVSVFTHFTETMQFRWLRELRRVTAPGGIVVITLHGMRCAQEALPPSELATLRTMGFLLRPRFSVDEAVRHRVVPGWWRATFHTKAYVMAQFSRYFAIRAYLPRALNHHQDIVLLQRAPAR